MYVHLSTEFECKPVEYIWRWKGARPIESAQCRFFVNDEYFGCKIISCVRKSNLANATQIFHFELYFLLVYFDFQLENYLRRLELPRLKRRFCNMNGQWSRWVEHKWQLYRNFFRLYILFPIEQQPADEYLVHNARLSTQIYPISAIHHTKNSLCIACSSSPMQPLPKWKWSTVSKLIWRFNARREGQCERKYQPSKGIHRFRLWTLRISCRQLHSSNAPLDLNIVYKLNRLNSIKYIRNGFVKEANFYCSHQIAHLS